VNTEESLQSIRRWLMVIALLLTVRVYYLASNGFNDAAGDMDDNIFILMSVLLGLLILASLASSFGGTQTETNGQNQDTGSS